MGADSQEEGGWKGGAPLFAMAAKAWPFAAFRCMQFSLCLLMQRERFLCSGTLKVSPQLQCTCKEDNQYGMPKKSLNCDSYHVNLVIDIEIP